MKQVQRIEIVEDQTQTARCDEGFLRLRRLRLRSHYSDGTSSVVYPCDIVSRRQVDAVAIVLYDQDEQRQVRVALRAGLRPAVWLSRKQVREGPQQPAERLIVEVVAGVLEDEDRGAAGLARRATLEAHEEAGITIEPGDTIALGGPLYPSPGITDERVFFRAARSDLDAAEPPPTDGSPMEEAGHVLVVPLDEALAACRSGDAPDMKTEVALLRLCDALGYLPLLDCFVDDLPAALRPSDARRAWLLGDASRARQDS